MIYVFGTSEFDTDRRVLRLAGTVVDVEPKVFDLLAYLIQHHDQFVSRQELYTQLWPQPFVSEAALTYCIAEARKAVGDNGRAQRVIKTVHGRGYRFIAPVLRRLPDSAPEEAALVPPPLLDTESAPLVRRDQREPARALQPAEATESAGPVPAPLSSERRQLTVLWCRGMAASIHSRPLDPEEFHQIVQDVQGVCDPLIQRFDGWIAQHFGDGFVVYFGHPHAHEDDARRAVHTALEIVRGVAQLSQDFKKRPGAEFTVHVGIHTGMVVISTMGSGARRAALALGSTPHVAAQLASLAAPNTVLISPTTLKLSEGYFVCATHGTYILDDPSESVVVYRVLQESAAQSRLSVALSTRLTPFVGREHEVGWLHERWEQSQGGAGQVVVVHGEAGLGKSRLVHEFQERLAVEHYRSLVCHCSPYHQHSPFYPMVEQVQHWLQWRQHETPSVQMEKLEQALAACACVLEEAVPLFASLLSLPLPARYPPLNLTPRQQKQRTIEVLLACFVKIAAQQPLCMVMEDVHWADPSTLEFLNLLVDQVPTARLLVLLTCRPEYVPPWSQRSYITLIALSRLTQPQTMQMIAGVAAGEVLPVQVQQHLAVKTNGVPLFVEEMTKMVLELGLLKEHDSLAALTGIFPALAIPSTLHDSFMARLDQQGIGKQVAQLGATLGREFSYRMIQAISPLDEAILQHGLTQLVKAEILYQRGVPPQAEYVFKHTLIQDTAYQSLLRRTRQQYHGHIAQVLEERFPETCTSQPELLAHHFTEAGLRTPAILYWQRAGQRALERSAYVEALVHLRQGLALSATLPDTPERLQHELTLSMALGAALMATQGFAAPTVEHAYIRAHACSCKVGDPLQIFTALRGLWLVYLVRGELQMAYEQGTHLLELAQRQQDPTLLIEAHRATGVSLCFLGELTAAWTHLEQGMALYEASQHSALIERYVQDPGMVCLVYAAWVLWWRGYPEQALQHIARALALAQQCQHPFCRTFALTFAVILHQCRRDPQAVSTYVEESLSLAQQYGFPLFVAMGGVFRNWALAVHRPGDESVEQIRAGIAAYRATGAELYCPYFLGLLAETYSSRGRPEAGLEILAEALAQVEMTGERLYAAGLYRLKGQLLLARSLEHSAEAEACFQQALGLARRQQARLLELQASISLSRLWQQQGQGASARHLLEEICGWFTEGFDIHDLTEAKALLDALR